MYRDLTEIIAEAALLSDAAVAAAAPAATFGQLAHSIVVAEERPVRRATVRRRWLRGCRRPRAPQSWGSPRPRRASGCNGRASGSRRLDVDHSILPRARAV